MLTKDQVNYPRDVFTDLILGNSPYAFYIFQWVPYQSDAKRWRLKLRHDVIAFDGRAEYGIWPNGNHCGSIKDEDVEFIRISREQFGGPYKDVREIADNSSENDVRLPNLEQIVTLLSSIIHDVPIEKIKERGVLSSALEAIESVTRAKETYRGSFKPK